MDVPVPLTLTKKEPGVQVGTADVTLLVVVVGVVTKASEVVPLKLETGPTTLVELDVADGAVVGRITAPVERSAGAVGTGCADVV